jgi:hypothetical protein
MRKTTILAKKEGAYGTDSIPTGAANAILVSEPSFKLVTQNAKRDIVRDYFGNSEELVGTKYVESSFKVEVAGSGTAGTPPAWAALLEACAFDGTPEGVIRVNYLPTTDVQDSVSQYFYRSGVRHISLGQRGKVTIGMKVGEIPKFAFTMMGLYGGVAAANPAGVDYTDFVTPKVVTDSNSLDLVIGGTVNSAGAPVITGGTAYPSLGIELDLGLDVPFTALVGGETIDVTDRQLTGKLTVDVTAAQEVALEADVLANTMHSIAFQHGTVAGNRVLVYLQQVQFTNPQDEELNGRLLKTYDLVVPPLVGNDEIQIIVF